MGAGADAASLILIRNASSVSKAPNARTPVLSRKTLSHALGESWFVGSLGLPRRKRPDATECRLGFLLICRQIPPGRGSTVCDDARLSWATALERR
jgi:hypothetical protein